MFSLWLICVAVALLAPARTDYCGEQVYDATEYECLTLSGNPHTLFQALLPSTSCNMSILAREADITPLVLTLGIASSV